MPLDLTPVPTGTDIQVNTYTANDQRFSAVAALTGGGFVVTWSSLLQDDGSSWGVYGQRYNADGSPAGAEFRANTHVSGSQFYSAVTALAGGGYVITWTSTSQDGSGYGIYGQRYNADGTSAGPEFRANSTTFDDQFLATVTALDDGGFLVTWGSFGQDGSSWGYYGQRYAADGATVGAEFRANTYTTSIQLYGSAAGLADGGFVVMWSSVYQDGDAWGVYGQRYNADGSPAGTEFRANTATNSDQLYPAVESLSGGGFVVTWSSYNQAGSGSYDIDGQRYNADGSTAGAEFRANTTTNNTQLFASVTALADGGYVISWSSDGQDGSGYGMYGQRFSADGSMVGVEFRLNATTLGTQYNENFWGSVGLTTLADGRLAATWSGFGGEEVFVRIIDVPSSNTQPTGMDATVTTLEDTAYVFALADFGYADADTDPFTSVRIDTLPAAMGGTLLLNSVAVTALQVILASAITAGELTFAPDANGYGTGHAAFTFSVSDGEAFDAAPNTITIDVTAVPDPTVFGGVDSQALIETNAAQTTGGTLTVFDPDGLASIVAQTDVAGANGYGRFTIGTDGVWSYTMDSAHDAFVAGVDYTDTLVVTASDGTTHTLTVTITGSDDTPTWTADGAGLVGDTLTVLEHSAGLVVTMSQTDLDGGPALTFSTTDPRFVIVGNELRVASDVAFDFERGDDLGTVTILSSNGSIRVLTLVVSDAAVDETSGASTAHDHIFGGDGNDRLRGGDGHDRLIGGDGNDRLLGGDGRDDLDGGDGNDALFGGAGRDSFGGGAGNDVLYFDVEDITAPPLGNTLAGLALDPVRGGSGFDYAIVDTADAVTFAMTDAASVEFVIGNAGNDTISAAGMTTFSYINGGDGDDVLSHGAAGGYLWGGGGHDTLTGGSSVDVLLGNSGADSLNAGDGNDVLYFDADDTAVIGGAGFDYGIVDTAAAVILTLTDAQGLDYVIGSNVGADSIDASAMAGIVYIDGAGGSDTLTLGSGGGVLWGGSGDDTLTGGTGVDILIGGAGADSLNGGDGSDVLYFDAADSAVIGGAGFDYAVVFSADAVAMTVTDAQSLDYVIGGSGNDTIDASGTTGVFYADGGVGNDRLLAGDGGGYLFGGEGQDQLVTLAGNSSTLGLIGGSGADTFVVNAGTGTAYIYDFNRADGDVLNVTATTGVTSFAELVIDPSPGSGWSIVTAGTTVFWVNTGSDGPPVAGDFTF